MLASDELTFMYGTAWKEDTTARLTREALEAGFTAIDTANQRKHYFEAAVGEGLWEAIDAGVTARDEVFLQTKFTHQAGQDDRLPYDAEADMATQVRQSFASSLEHLRVKKIDSYVIHGPSARVGLPADDQVVWRTMEEIWADGRVRYLGISNVSAAQLAELVEFADAPVTFVQNRCFANTGWDAETRAVCQANGIIYQGFSLLTANARELSSAAVKSVASEHKATVAQVVFRFAQQVGMLPLTGTTDPSHMSEDLACKTFDLTDDQIDTLLNLAS